MNKAQLDIFDFQTKMIDRRIKWFENDIKEIEADLKRRAEIIQRAHEEAEALAAEHPDPTGAWLKAIKDNERAYQKVVETLKEKTLEVTRSKRSMEELCDQHKFRNGLREAIVDNIRQTEEASKPQKMGWLSWLGMIVMYENLKPKR